VGIYTLVHPLPCTSRGTPSTPVHAVRGGYGCSAAGRRSPGLSPENSCGHEAHRTSQPPKGVRSVIPLRAELLRPPGNKSVKDWIATGSPYRISLRLGTSAQGPLFSSGHPIVGRMMRGEHPFHCWLRVNVSYVLIMGPGPPLSDILDIPDQLCADCSSSAFRRINPEV